MPHAVFPFSHLLGPLTARSVPPYDSSEEEDSWIAAVAEAVGLMDGYRHTRRSSFHRSAFRSGILAKVTFNRE